MSRKLVDLKEILRTLRDQGPLSGGALARELDLYAFDMRLALLEAASWGLIGPDRRGAWTLTERGVALVAPDVVAASAD
jgi:hypothetical protein